MAKIHSKTVDLFLQHLNSKGSRWELANNILYEMCKKHPLHKNEDEIVAKLWIIGRTYAAALERRKNKKDDENDFYYEEVVPVIKKISSNLDDSIKVINKTGKIVDILKTHKLLVDYFKKLTELEKRSLASKYLHFHCPKAVYIYDSIAKSSLSKLVKYSDKSFLKNINKESYDETYASFITRILILKNHLETSLNIKLSPRDMDNFLLSKTMQCYKG